MSIKKEELIREYSKAIREGTAAIFAGAGFSRPCGYVDWKGLLRQLAEDIDLEIDKETDLLAVAQYYVNQRGNRDGINKAIIEAFSKDADTNKNDYAQIVSRLPIGTYWTTNYDHVIEDSLKNAKRNADVKTESNQLQTSMPNCDAVVYKMHGDVDKPANAVLVKEDYELYDSIRPLFRETLKRDFVSKTFLFIGFSFEDPNVDFLLGQILSSLKQHARTHYCFFRREKKTSKMSDEEYDYCLRKQSYQEINLRRYGIQTVFVDEYSEIAEILRQIELESRRKRVFISGSADDYSGFWDKAQAEELVRCLTKELIKSDYSITSGFGLGIGSMVITSAIEEIYASKGGNLDKYLSLFPFPQNIMDPAKKAAQRTQYRENMIRSTGASIFLFGNKKDPGTKSIVNSNGCIEEYNISRTNGNIVVPIGTTGYAAKEISDIVKTDLSSFSYLTGHLSTLEASNNIDEIIDTILKILDI